MVAKIALVSSLEPLSKHVQPRLRPSIDLWLEAKRTM